MKKNTTTFGLHFMLDAYGVEAKKLADMKLIYKFLNKLPEIIKMRKLGLPSVIDVGASGKGKDPGGISGFIMIAESHISIHTFPDKGTAFIDIFSCRSFDVESARREMVASFNAQDDQLTLIDRAAGETEQFYC